MIKVYGKEFSDWQFGTIKHTYEKESNWDVEFFPHYLMNDKKTITPSVNLISNFGDVGTHFNNHTGKQLYILTSVITIDDTFEDKGTEMLMNVKNKTIKSILAKENYMSNRVKLYLFK